MFDARVFTIPKEEVTNLIYWRQLDATRNSIQMVGQANFSHKELQNKSCNEIQDMLMLQKNINWNNFPVSCKRGSCCIKKELSEVVDTSGKFSGGIQAIRTGWVIDDNIPIFKEADRAYIDKLVYIGDF
jgi:tRNA(His) 5'-end guanylyltransferase